MRVLVTDGRERVALAVVRSLGRAGHRMEVASTGGGSLAGASRHCARDHSCPEPLREPDAFARRVRRLAVDETFDVLVPMSEASLHAVLPRRAEFEDVVIPFPDYEVFDAVCDKAHVQGVAEQLGIAVPDQMMVTVPSESREVPDQQAFPLVVKPSRSVIETGGQAAKTHVRFARDRRQLATVLDEVPEEGYPVLIQERIDGPGTGVFLLLWDEELVASFCHRRIREKPPSGGVSVLRESVPADRELVAASRELLESFGWSGVAMVEYKRDRDTGTPYLMEINGRFWGSLQLAVDAGVDFPRLLVEAASGGDPASVSEYEEGVRTRWTLGDLDHLLARLRFSREELDLGPDAPRGAKVLWSFLTGFGPGSRSEVFRWSDPRPAVREAKTWLRDAG